MELTSSQSFQPPLQQNELHEIEINLKQKQERDLMLLKFSQEHDSLKLMQKQDMYMLIKNQQQEKQFLHEQLVQSSLQNPVQKQYLSLCDLPERAFSKRAFSKRVFSERDLPERAFSERDLPERAISERDIPSTLHERALPDSTSANILSLKDLLGFSEQRAKSYLIKQIKPKVYVLLDPADKQNAENVVGRLLDLEVKDLYLLSANENELKKKVMEVSLKIKNRAKQEAYTLLASIHTASCDVSTSRS
jgi:hypothetical protein